MKEFCWAKEQMGRSGVNVACDENGFSRDARLAVGAVGGGFMAA